MLSGRERDYATIENPSRRHRRFSGLICAFRWIRENTSRECAWFLARCENRCVPYPGDLASDLGPSAVRQSHLALGMMGISCAAAHSASMLPSSTHRSATSPRSVKRGYNHSRRTALCGMAWHGSGTRTGMGKGHKGRCLRNRFWPGHFMSDTSE